MKSNTKEKDIKESSSREDFNVINFKIKGHENNKDERKNSITGNLLEPFKLNKNDSNVYNSEQPFLLNENNNSEKENKNNENKNSKDKDKNEVIDIKILNKPAIEGSSSISEKNLLCPDINNDNSNRISIKKENSILKNDPDQPKNESNLNLDQFSNNSNKSIMESLKVNENQYRNLSINSKNSDTELKKHFEINEKSCRSSSNNVEEYYVHNEKMNVIGAKKQIEIEEENIQSSSSLKQKSSVKLEPLISKSNSENKRLTLIKEQSKHSYKVNPKSP